MVRGNRDPASPAVRVEPVGAHVDEWMRARARGVVAVHACGAEDLRLFLDALGIDERSAGLRESGREARGGPWASRDMAGSGSAAVAATVVVVSVTAVVLVFFVVPWVIAFAAGVLLLAGVLEEAAEVPVAGAVELVGGEAGGLQDVLGAGGAEAVVGFEEDGGPQFLHVEGPLFVSGDEGFQVVPGAGGQQALAVLEGAAGGGGGVRDRVQVGLLLGHEDSAQVAQLNALDVPVAVIAGMCHGGPPFLSGGVVRGCRPARRGRSRGVPCGPAGFRSQLSRPGRVHAVTAERPGGVGGAEPSRRSGAGT